MIGGINTKETKGNEKKNAKNQYIVHTCRRCIERRENVYRCVEADEIKVASNFESSLGNRVPSTSPIERDFVKGTSDERSFQGIERNFLAWSSKRLSVRTTYRSLRLGDPAEAKRINDFVRISRRETVQFGDAILSRHSTNYSYSTRYVPHIYIR